MAVGTLTGSTIATTYKSLLKVKGGANTILDADIQLIEDGDGVDSVLGLATDSALISGNGSKLYFYDADGGEYISADNAGILSIAAGAEVDLASAAIDINATGAVTIDSADDSNLTVTGSNKDLAISVAGGSTQTLTISSAGTGTNAIDINATGGGVDVDAAAAVDILAATTLSAKGATGASFGDDTGTW